MAMFGYFKHVLDWSNFENDGETNGDGGVIDIGLIKTMDEGVHPMMKLGSLINIEVQLFLWKEY